MSYVRLTDASFADTSEVPRGDRRKLERIEPDARVKRSKPASSQSNACLGAAETESRTAG